MKNKKTMNMQKKKSSIKIFLLVAILMSCCLCGCEQSSKVILAIEHPFEAIFSTIHLDEKQHGVQQQYDGSHETTLIWSTSNHTISDRSRELFASEKPFSRIKIPSGIALLFFFGNTEAAYNLTLARNVGKHGENFNFLFYHYKTKKPCPIIFKLDGVSNAIYSFNYITYIPYKILRRFSCTIDESKCGGLGWWSIFDGIWGIFISIIEGVIAFFIGIIGLVTGTICHPINSICNLIPGVFFIFWDVLCAICALVVSVIEVILSIISGFWAFLKFITAIVIVFSCSLFFLRSKE